MPDLGPWMITAHSSLQAEYVARAQAEQRGYQVTALTVSGGAGEMWHVIVTVRDAANPPEDPADNVQVIGLDGR